MKINDIIKNYILENKYKTLYWISVSILLYPLHGVIIPKYYGLVINSFKDKKFFTQNVMYLILFYILSMILGVLGLLSTKLIIPSFGEYITTKFYNHILDNYHMDFDNIETGAIISKLVNIPNLFFTYIETFRTMVFSQLFIFITTLYHYWYVSNKLFVCFLVSIIINYLYIYNLYKQKFDIDKDNHKAKAVLYQFITDTLLNLVSVFSFNQEDKEKSNFKNIEYKNYKSILQKSLDIYVTSSIKWNILCVFIFFFLNYYLYKAYKEKKITTDVLVSTFTITFAVFEVFENSIAVSNQVSKLLSEVYEIEVYFNEIKKKNANNKKIQNPFKNGNIEFKNVYFKYTDQWVLNNVNISIKRGEHVMLVGKIGSGKSTIVNLLMKYNKLVRGEITINNVNINTITYDEIHRNIYYIPQNPKLFNRTLYQNIVYGLNKPPSKNQIIQLLNDLELEDVGIAFTKIMDKKVGLQGSKLSGGQRQIVWLLRSFYRDKSIIIMDEPTSALDGGNKINMIKNIKRLCLGKTLIIISHDPINEGFRIIKIKNGKIEDNLNHNYNLIS